MTGAAVRHRRRRTLLLPASFLLGGLVAVTLVSGIAVAVVVGGTVVPVVSGRSTIPDALPTEASRPAAGEDGSLTLLVSDAGAGRATADLRLVRLSADRSDVVVLTIGRALVGQGADATPSSASVAGVEHLLDVRVDHVASVDFSLLDAVPDAVAAGAGLREALAPVARTFASDDGLDTSALLGVAWRLRSLDSSDVVRGSVRADDAEALGNALRADDADAVAAVLAGDRP